MIKTKEKKKVGRMFRFLRFCALLFVLFFTGNLMAAGYTCSTTATYTSCKEGYYLEACGTDESDWLGQTTAPVTGKTCLECPEGYECSGGLNCPLRTGIHCDPGTYVKAGDTKCTSCPAGKYCSGFDTDDEAATETDRGITGTCPAGKYCPTGTGTPNACPAYYGTSAAGSDAQSDCYTTCAVGTAVTAPTLPCGTPAGAWYSPAAHTVYYGSISPIGYCPYGSDSRDGVTSLHDQGADCLVTVPAGYSSTVSTTKTRYIRISTASSPFPLAGIQAYKSSGAQATLTAASSMTNASYATDSSLSTQATVTTSISGVGYAAVFDMGAETELKSIKFALGKDSNTHSLTVAISSDNASWTTVFSGNVTGVSALPGVLQTVNVFTRANTKCAAGTYNDAATVYAANGVTCTACPTAICNGETNCASGFSTHRNTYPDNYHSDDNLKLVRAWFATASNTGNTSIEECKLSYSYTNNRGTFNQDAVRYQSSTGRYDGVGGTVYYTVLNPGYYGSGKLSDVYCDTDTNVRRHYYQDALLCPAGKYCSGYTQMPLCSSGTYNDTMGITGSVSVGYFSTGGAKVAAPTTADCVGTNNTCGPLAAGYFSVQPGMVTPTPTYMAQRCSLATIDGQTSQPGCGWVDSGYYSTGGGTHPRPTASGNGCIAGQECGTVAAGYYSTGGAKSKTGDGAVHAGYYSTGGAIASTPESNEDCVGDNSCGLLSGGYFSTGGATKAAPTSADCVGFIGPYIWSSSGSPVGNVCGQVLGGYYSTEGGILPAPGNLGATNTAALGFNIDYLNQGLDSVRAGCVGGSSKCGMISAGYYSTGGATVQTPDSNEYCVGDESCGICGIGQYSAAGATSCSSCPAVTSGWEYLPYTGGTSYTSCQQYATPDGCAAGKVFVRAASATTWNPLTAATPYSWANSDTVLTAKPGYYRTSGTAVTCTICPAGTYSTGGAVSSCTKVNAGYYASGAATSPSPSSADCVSGTCGICAKGTYSAEGATSCSSCPALGGSNWAWDMSQGAESYSACKRTGVPDGCIAGTVTDTATSATTWGNRVMAEWVSPGNTQFLAKAGHEPNASKLECTLCQNGYYSTDYTSFSCNPVSAGYYATGAATSSTPSSADCVTGTCGLIDAGYWGAAGATRSTGSGTVNAGYYATGGGTSATPTASGNGCISGKECGKLAPGYFSVVDGMTTATPVWGTDCTGSYTESSMSNSTLQKCGMVGAGAYSTGGGISAIGSSCVDGEQCGNVAAGYYSTGGGTSATPTAAGDGCLDGFECGTVDAGYYSTGAGMHADGRCNSKLGFDCGTIAAGYWSQGGAKTETPASTSDCVNGKCGLIHIGFYSTGGGKTPRPYPDFIQGVACLEGFECGYVAAGYYSNGGGTSATPTAFGDGCVGQWNNNGTMTNHICGQLDAGYYSTGGAITPTPTTSDCHGYDITDETAVDANRCGMIAAGYWGEKGATESTGAGLVNAGYWNNGCGTSATGDVCSTSYKGGQVDAGYYNLGGGTSPTPEVRGTGCVNLSSTQCGTIAPGFWGEAGATRYAGTGKVSAGYFSTGGGTSATPGADDCAGNVAIIDSTTGKLMGASDVENTCGLVAAGYWNNGAGINAQGGVSNGYEGGQVAAGYFSTGGGRAEEPVDSIFCVDGQNCGLIAAGHWGEIGAGTSAGSGQVNAGYFSTMGGTSPAPNGNGNGCVSASAQCGIIAAGYWGEKGAITAQGSGAVDAGYYATGGGTSKTPTAAGNGCLSTKACGPVDAGYYATGGATTAQGHGMIKLGLYSTCGATSTGGSNLASSDYLECVEGCECGRVAPGYYATGGGTSATPMAAGNGCLAGQDCGTMAAGYYSRGGAGSATASAQYCWGYNTYSDGVNGCGKLSAEYYSNGGSTDNGATCVSGKVCGTCNANYRANTETGKTAATQCQASCSAGTRVATVNAACTSPAGGWFSAAHLVNYGQISPVNYCMDGYTSASTSASGHDAATDCVQTIAGKSVDANTINARYIKITSDGSESSPDTHVLEIEAFASNNGTGTNLLSGKGGITGSKLTAATNGDWARKTGEWYAQGSALTWDLGSVQALGSLKFAMYTDGREYQNVAIAVSEDNVTYTTVFATDKLLTQNTTTPTGELVVLSAAPKACAAGTYKASGSLALTNTSSCDAAQAGYFVGTTGATTQTKCVMGSYTDTTGQSACKACAGGKTNSEDGATSCTATCSNATGVASTGWETPSWGTDNKMINLCTVKATAGCSANYYKNSNACTECPSTTYPYSVAGATAQTQCYANVTLNKNGFSGSIAAGAGTGCKVASAATGTNNATLQVYYNTECTLPTISGFTQTGYTAASGWASANTIGASAVTKLSASTSKPAATYYARKTTCGADYYKKDTTTCSTCASGTNSKYTLSAAGTASDVNVCYLNTTAKNFVKTPGAGQITCEKGNYCPGSVKVYYGGTASDTHPTTGGSTQCPANSYCVAGVSAAVACSTLGGGLYKNSTAGSDAAEDCNFTTTAGKYMVANTDTAQTTCPGKQYCEAETLNWPNVSVLNNGGWNDCPDAATHKRTSFPADYYSPTMTSTSLVNLTGQGSKSRCRVISQLSSATHGDLYEYAIWNSENNTYDLTADYGWQAVKPGYYLTTPAACGTYAYYHDVKECEENSYCPGKDKVACDSSNQATVHTDTFGIYSCSADTDGNYELSSGGVAANSINKCYLKTNVGDWVATANAAQTDCQADGWCPGNVTVYYGSTGGRTACVAPYGLAAAGSDDVNDCYLKTTAGQYVKTAGAGQITCPAGYWCVGNVAIYKGGSVTGRSTTGGSEQCPAGYRDGTTGYSLQSQCTMNVAGGKYVAVVNESSASGTCKQGYAKAAHPVTYGATSSCDACTGATYADQEGMSECTACPTATTEVDSGLTVDGIYRYNTSDHSKVTNCYTRLSKSTDVGDISAYCYANADGVYGYTYCDGFSGSVCNPGYYYDGTRNYTGFANVIKNVCKPVGESHYFAGGEISGYTAQTRGECETGLVTCGAGLCANEAGDCGRKLHAGDNVIYLRSEKRTTPSLNVKVGDKMFYGNLGDVIANSLRVKNGTKNYSVVNDNQ